MALERGTTPEEVAALRATHPGLSFSGRGPSGMLIGEKPPIERPARSELQIWLEQNPGKGVRDYMRERADIQNASDARYRRPESPQRTAGNAYELGLYAVGWDGNTRPTPEQADKALKVLQQYHVKPDDPATEALMRSLGLPTGGGAQSAPASGARGSRANPLRFNPTTGLVE